MLGIFSKNRGWSRFVPSRGPNTPIAAANYTTAGDLTITVAQMRAGVLTRDPNGAAAKAAASGFIAESQRSHDRFHPPAMFRMRPGELLHLPEQEEAHDQDREEEILPLGPQAHDPQGGQVGLHQPVQGPALGPGTGQ